MIFSIITFINIKISFRNFRIQVKCVFHVVSNRIGTKLMSYVCTLVNNGRTYSVQMSFEISSSGTIVVND